VKVGPADVVAADERVRSFVRTTPVIEVEMGTGRVSLKLELLQHTGSFKPRGALNRVLAAGSVPETGLIAASGGNHGAAVAFVARALDRPAEVFVPEVTPAIKRDRIAGLGATVTVVGRHYPDAQEEAERRAVATGALMVHPYDHPDTVAGQGTMARELEDQVGVPDTVLVAAGGGGLAAGVAAWFGQRASTVVVEPSGSDAFHAARAAGAPVAVDIDSVASDSLGARQIGAVPFAVLSDTGAASVLVDDEAIVAAQRWMWDRLRLVVEPGGAAAAGAVLSGAYRPEAGERVVVVVCGANTDPATVTGSA
jgi:threonine dehydratase